MKKRDCLKLSDLNAKEINGLITRALFFKKNKGRAPHKLKGKILGLIFEKSSTRTRVSFEAAMTRLGGSSVYLDKNASQLGRGETYADTARVLSRYLDGLVLRAYAQHDLEEMASHSRIPVINGLTDLYHPCQLLADLMTLMEYKKNLKKIKVAYVGDGNNMANSWLEASLLLGFELRIGCPAGFLPSAGLLLKAKRSPWITVSNNPVETVRGVDVINTDTWFSMGQEVTNEKKEAFRGFQVNKELLDYAHQEAIVLHCLPAHRGEEITDDVMDGDHSVIFDQAENRLYVQMALLEELL